MNIISRKEAVEQGLKRYFTGKPCNHGHICERSIPDSGRCCECQRLRSIKYYKENREKENARGAKWRKENPEKNKMSGDNWYKENSDKKIAYSRKYYSENLDARRAAAKKYRKDNPLSTFIRKSLERVVKNWKGDAAKYEAILGYTNKELKAHIERQFVKGMNWENRSEWHIDHIISISHYLENGVTDPMVINCLSNLQPIWAKDNFSKGSKVLTLC